MLGWRCLVKNFERTLSHATTKINLCFVRLMLKRLQSLPEISNGFYTTAAAISFFSSLLLRKGIELEDI